MDIPLVQDFAFYGSLRKGMYNYDKYYNDLNYLFSARLSGYKLFSLGSYPSAVKTHLSEHAIAVDVFRIITKSTRTLIHKIEMDAGYYFELIEFRNYRLGIYLMEKMDDSNIVKGGDWVDYLSKQTHS